MKKRGKKILSLMLALSIVLCMMPGTAAAGTAAPSTTGFAGGSGTEADPYIISTKAQLNNVRNYMNACYRLNADIVFTAADFEENGDFYNDGKGWLPLGASQTNAGNETAFRGIFDGNGHVIKGLYINRPNENDTGLFKYLGGTIKSLGLEEGQIIGSTRVGAFVGMVDTYTPKYERQILDCYNTCTVKAVNGYAGGIVGEGRGTIDKCYNAGEIKSGSSGCAGGIVPIMQYGSISNCYNSGDVVTDGYTAGGIAGQIYSASASKSYSVGTQYYGTAYNGHAKGFGYVMNSTSSETEKTIGEMKQKETFESFDFDTVWSISSNGSYPYPTLQTVANASKQSSLSVKHKGITVNAKEVSCTEDGYTGDLTCEGCGEKLSSGSTLKALGHVESENYEYDKNSHWKVCTRETCGAKICEGQHTGGSATLSERAVCTVCGQAYGKYLPGEIVISGSSVTEKQGREVIVDLNLDENTGLASMLVELEYDKGVLEFVGAENGNVFDIGSFDGPDTESDYKVLSWQNGVLKQNIIKTGKLATLKFKIKDASPTGETEIKFLCDSNKYEAIDVKGDAVTVTSENAKVNVINFYYGDVDGNNNVDSSDVLHLRRYLAKWKGYAANAEASDLDLDEKITLRDITILQRYIAGWTGYEKLPIVDETLTADSQESEL